MKWEYEKEIERLEARLQEAERLLRLATDTCSGWCEEQIDAFLRPTDSAPAVQPCGHPWKAQHDFKCILCSSPDPHRTKP